MAILHFGRRGGQVIAKPRVKACPSVLLWLTRCHRGLCKVPLLQDLASSKGGRRCLLRGSLCLEAGKKQRKEGVRACAFLMQHTKLTAIQFFGAASFVTDADFEYRGILYGG